MIKLASVVIILYPGVSLLLKWSLSIHSGSTASLWKGVVPILIFGLCTTSNSFQRLDWSRIYTGLHWPNEVVHQVEDLLQKIVLAMACIIYLYLSDRISVSISILCSQWIFKKCNISSVNVIGFYSPPPKYVYAGWKKLYSNRQQFLAVVSTSPDFLNW